VGVAAVAERLRQLGSLSIAAVVCHSQQHSWTRADTLDIATSQLGGAKVITATAHRCCVLLGVDFFA
jgi:hypothetical protein